MDYSYSFQAECGIPTVYVFFMYTVSEVNLNYDQWIHFWNHKFKNHQVIYFTIISSCFMIMIMSMIMIMIIFLWLYFYGLNLSFSLCMSKNVDICSTDGEILNRKQVKIEYETEYNGKNIIRIKMCDGAKCLRH